MGSVVPWHSHCLQTFSRNGSSKKLFCAVFPLSLDSFLGGPVEQESSAAAGLLLAADGGGATETLEVVFTCETCFSASLSRF